MQRSLGEKVFNVFNIVFLSLAAVSCVAPMIHVLALSLSSKTAASAGLVSLWPVDFTLKSYEYILSKSDFQLSLLVSIQRVALGLALNMLLTILIAYPLSKEVKQFPLRTACAWYFLITILFSGGLIPTYMVVKQTGLINSIFALVIPCAVPVFNAIVLLNFFRGIPKALEESALIDGAGHWRILWSIYVPLSLPALATLILFSAVNHWNAWFDGLIYINDPKKYPLQTYLQTMVIQSTSAVGTIVNIKDLEMMEAISDRTAKAAQIFIGSLPIISVYPFLQRYFIKGIVLGSVKQ